LVVDASDWVKIRSNWWTHALVFLALFAALDRMMFAILAIRARPSLRRLRGLV
jgi:hypothetical protein